MEQFGQIREGREVCKSSKTHKSNVQLTFPILWIIHSQISKPEIMNRIREELKNLQNHESSRNINIHVWKDFNFSYIRLNTEISTPNFYQNPTASSTQIWAFWIELIKISIKTQILPKTLEYKYKLHSCEFIKPSMPNQISFLENLTPKAKIGCKKKKKFTLSKISDWVRIRP